MKQISREEKEAVTKRVARDIKQASREDGEAIVTRLINNLDPTYLSVLSLALETTPEQTEDLPDKDLIQCLLLRVFNLETENTALADDSNFDELGGEYLSEVNRALRILRARLTRLGVTYDNGDDSTPSNIANIYHDSKLWMQFDLNQLDSSSFHWIDCRQDTEDQQ